MEISTKESIRTERKMEKAPCTSRIRINMKDSGLKVKDMEKGKSKVEMGMFMKGITKTIKKMGKD